MNLIKTNQILEYQNINTKIRKRIGLFKKIETRGLIPQSLKFFNLNHLILENLNLLFIQNSHGSFIKSIVKLL